MSVFTSSKLSPELAATKRRLALSLIRFEEALVELDPFVKNHPFETFDFLLAMLVKHYRDELVSQAAVILGSTDFLGNPLGFVNDVSVGVSGLIYEGSVSSPLLHYSFFNIALFRSYYLLFVFKTDYFTLCLLQIGSLVKNVTHGLSNSAAKVTGTLGEGLGKTLLDSRHEEERRKIMEDNVGSSGSHLYAGLMGFGHGLIGGVTSIVSQSYEGVSTEGFSVWFYFIILLLYALIGYRYLMIFHCSLDFVFIIHLADEKIISH